MIRSLGNPFIFQPCTVPLGLQDVALGRTAYAAHSLPPDLVEVVADEAQLEEQDAMLEGIVLKPSMIIPGTGTAAVGRDVVASRTVDCLKRTVPDAVPGIAFLSGGQSDEDATGHLDAMNKLDGHPWNLTFSYGKALQATAMKTWAGKAENLATASAAFMQRARSNAAASTGEWDQTLEQSSS